MAPARRMAASLGQESAFENYAIRTCASRIGVDLVINRLEVRQLQSVLALFELFHPDRC